MRNFTARTRLASLVMMVLVSACSQGKAESAKVPSGGEKTAVEAGTDSRSYSETLERLGFYVFKEPIPLPDRIITSLDGKTESLSALTGSVTLLNFWATWCPPCRREMPSIERLHAAMRGFKFRIVAVSTGENAKDVSSFAKREGYTFPIYLDPSGSLGAEFASQGIPTTYVVDSKGMILAGAVGSREYDDPDLIAAFREMSR